MLCHLGTPVPDVHLEVCEMRKMCVCTLTVMINNISSQGSSVVAKVQGNYLISKTVCLAPHMTRQAPWAPCTHFSCLPGTKALAMSQGVTQVPFFGLQLQIWIPQDMDENNLQTLSKALVWRWEICNRIQHCLASLYATRNLETVSPNSRSCQPS